MTRHLRRAWMLVMVVVAACSAQPAGSTSPSAIASISTPVSSPSQSAEVSASPSAAPSAAIPKEWTRVLTFGDGSAQMVGGPIVHGSAGFIVLGTRWEGGEGGPRPTEYSLWRSSDGLEWRELTVPFDPQSLFVSAFAGARDGSYIVHGTRPLSAPGEYESVALRSSDGVTWEELDTGLPKVIFVQAIELGPAGYLLVGGQGAETNPSLWLSEDGLAWEQVYEFDQTQHFVQIHDADGGDEGYVVLGRRIEADGSYRRFSFASADGREWFNRDAPFGPDNQGFVFEANVVSRGPDWLATLGHPESLTATWTSPDGLEWSESGSLEAPAATSAGLLEEIGAELLFSPGSGTGFDGTAGVWTSTDGAAWSPVDLGAEAWLRGLALDGGMVAVSGTIRGEDFTSMAGVWVRASH